MDKKLKRQFGGDKTDVLLIPPIINIMNPDLHENSLFQGVAALDAGLKAHGFNSVIYVPKLSLFKNEDYLSVAENILTFRPAIIGFSTWCFSYPASLLVSEKIKELNPEIYIVFGGPQASSLGKETMERFPFVDYVLGGECDYTFPELAGCLTGCHSTSELYKISGLTFRSSDGTICQNNTEGFVQNLDLLPYISFSQYNKNQKKIMLDIGRGCPFHCTYCSTSHFFSKTYRTKSTERILAEMDLAFGQLGIRHFEFLHDMLTLNKSFMVELCMNLINRKKTKRKFSWNCSARIDCITEDILKLMKEAGCRAIFFGIESGSEKIQHLIKKNLHVENVYEIAEICRNLGIDVHASFIIGFPDETEEDIEKTLLCIAGLSARGVFTQLSELSVLPGTPLYFRYRDQLKLDGLLSYFSGSFYNPEEVRLITKYPELFSSFYYLPVSTLDRLSLYHLKNLVNQLHQFRNTLFILKETLHKDLQNTNLFLIFLKHLPNLKEHMNKKIPPITFLITCLKDYLLAKHAFADNRFIYHVFAYESIIALMLARYVRWKMIEQYSEMNKSSEFPQKKTGCYHLVPYWQTISTFYRLKSILPSENGWRTRKLNARKGDFNYLIIAVSDLKCKVSRITSAELGFLNQLSEKAVKSKDYLSSYDISGCEADPLWKKMNKLGVIKMTG
jgi:radical SAM superfamily enzyme YgiQ (UPF0313 family)